jgi:hypothetical protein
VGALLGRCYTRSDPPKHVPVTRECWHSFCGHLEGDFLERAGAISRKVIESQLGFLVQCGREVMTRRILSRSSRITVGRVSARGIIFLCEDQDIDDGGKALKVCQDRLVEA